MLVRLRLGLVAFAIGTLACGCSGGDDDSGSGGSSGSGGAAASGGSAGSGASAGTGGSSGSGGSAGTGGGTSQRPGVDPTKNVTALDDTEKAELCDWFTALFGGYDMITDCGGQIRAGTYADQATCVRIEFYGICDFTVDAWETCKEAMAPTKACMYPDACEKIICRAP